MPGDEIIPFTESLLRVFDRYGERNNRHKARLKYLLNQLGTEELLRLAAAERIALPQQKIAVELPEAFVPQVPASTFTTFRVSNDAEFAEWKNANVFPQKQNGWFGVHVLIPQGNISSEQARNLAAIADRYIAGDLRITPGQSFLLRFVPAAALPALFRELRTTGLAATGANAFADITSCPGTDTCNLGISNSTGVSAVLSQLIRKEFPGLVAKKNIAVRISGCMNSCGQHGLAEIGFHGSSLKAGDAVVPALQLLLGGGASGSGNGRIAEKVIKFPSRRAPAVLRVLLSDFTANAAPEENFHAYYDRRGKNYFYQLIRPLADTGSLKEEELIDWNQEEKFETAIGVGECAGVKIDLTATLLLEAKEALALAEENLANGKFADAVYKAYNAYVHTAKALLTREGIAVNSQLSVLKHFDTEFQPGFSEKVLQINRNAPSAEFAEAYIREAKSFSEKAGTLRRQATTTGTIHLN